MAVTVTSRSSGLRSADVGSGLLVGGDTGEFVSAVPALLVRAPSLMGGAGERDVAVLPVRAVDTLLRF